MFCAHFRRFFRVKQDGFDEVDEHEVAGPGRFDKVTLFPDKQAMRRYLPFAIILTVFLIASGVGVELYQNRSSNACPEGESLPSANQGRTLLIFAAQRRRLSRWKSSVISSVCPARCCGRF